MTGVQQEANDSDAMAFAAYQDDSRLVTGLQRGDEAAFVWLIEQYHAAMIRLALIYVPQREAAEEVVQDAWLGVLKGIDHFEGRSSLKTWIFRILINRAKTYGRREARATRRSAPWDFDEGSDEPAVESERFLSEHDPKWPGHWSVTPYPWEAIPEDHALHQEMRLHILHAIDALPPGQRQVITLRDVDGWSSDAVCDLLGISETNQRALLHRARSKVRRALEAYLGRSKERGSA